MSMTILELNKVISGNYDGMPVATKEPVLITEEDVILFLSTFSVDDYVKSVFEATENYIQFYECLPWLKKCFDPSKAKEVFYAAKCGILYDGVPPTVIFLLKKALAEYEYKYANLAISLLNRNMLIPYLKEGILPTGTSYRDVVSNIVGRSVKLITASNLCVDVNGVSELYVPNTDQIALVPTDMLEGVSDLDDLRTVEFVPELGITIKGIPIRTLGGRMGLTRNDFDLRGCL